MQDQQNPVDGESLATKIADAGLVLAVTAYAALAYYTLIIAG